MVCLFCFFVFLFFCFFFGCVNYKKNKRATVVNFDEMTELTERLEDAYKPERRMSKADASFFQKIISEAGDWSDDDSEIMTPNSKRGGISNVCLSLCLSVSFCVCVCVFVFL